MSVTDEKQIQASTETAIADARAGVRPSVSVVALEIPVLPCREPYSGDEGGTVGKLTSDPDEGGPL